VKRTIKWWEPNALIRLGNLMSGSFSRELNQYSYND